MATVLGFGGRRFRRGSEEKRPNPPGRKINDILSLGVIPRLLMAHSRPAEERTETRTLIRLEDVLELVPVAVDAPAHLLLEKVEAVMQRGVTAEEVFVDLLAPVARALGEDWKEDRLDFVQVSMALWRLQEVLRHIAASAPRAEAAAARSALFAPMPGDQHSFGPAIVQECFTLAGWDAEMLAEDGTQPLIAAVADRYYDLLGLTVACDCHSDRLASLIKALRSVSRNPNLCIMIGGRLVDEQPQLVGQVGADGTAPTAVKAVDVAERLVETFRFAATA